MASISKRISQAGKITWFARIRRKGSPVACRSFSLRSDAVRWATREEARTEREAAGLLSRGDSKTLAELASQFLAGAPKIATQHDRTRRLLWWVERFGSVRLRDWHPTIVTSGIRQLEAPRTHQNALQATLRHRTPQTIRHYLMALSACFEYGRTALGWVTKNPVRDVPIPPVSPARIRWLNDEQRQRLLDACDRSGNPVLGLVVRIALVSGARLSEIMSLRWEWVEEGSECAFLPITKNGDPRVLPIPGPLMEALQDRREGRQIGLVFPSPVDREKPRNVRQAWVIARRRAGLNGWRFHDCRHDAATSMLRAGVDSRVVAAVLGHRSMNMLARYAHVQPEAIVAAARRCHADAPAKG